MANRKQRSKLKQAVKTVLKEKGPLKQNELVKEVWEHEKGIYANKQSLAVTLSQVREKWEETGLISTEEKVPDRGSLTTHEWSLK